MLPEEKLVSQTGVWALLPSLPTPQLSPVPRKSSRRPSGAMHPQASILHHHAGAAGPSTPVQPFPASSSVGWAKCLLVETARFSLRGSHDWSLCNQPTGLGHLWPQLIQLSNSLRFLVTQQMGLRQALHSLDWAGQGVPTKPHLVGWPRLSSLGRFREQGMSGVWRNWGAEGSRAL